MQAAWFCQFGPAEKVLEVGEIERPVASAGEVLVRLATSAINPSDVKKRAGSFPDLLDGGLVIPNSDGAGVIEAVGSGVSAARIGERVWIYQAQYARRFGTAAQFVAIDASRAVTLADEISFEIGACLGIPAMTAHRAVFADGRVDGQTIVITGGAGRVGHYAIQWASQAGARVIATASNRDDIATCIEAGAQAVVNHRDPDWDEQIIEQVGGANVDRVIDVEFGANLDKTLKFIGTSGVITSYSSTQVSEPTLPFFQMMYKDLTVRLIIVYAMPEPAKAHAIADIGTALAEQLLIHRVAHVLPLHEIVRGNQLIEAGGLSGSVILTTNSG